MRRVLTVALGALGAGGLLLGVAAAAGPFRLPLGGATGGGGTSTDGYFTLHAAAGQPFAGTLAADDMRLSAGVLGKGAVRVQRIVPALARDR